MRALSLPRFSLKTPGWVTVLVTHMSRTERLVAAWLVVVLVTSGVLSVMSYIRRNTHLVPQAGGVYTEAAVGQPQYLNPILAGTNDIDVDIGRLVYSPLFRLNQNLELVNDLSAGYEVSADTKEYTVRLRQDVRWHDGEPFTADDVIFTIRSIQTPDYGSPLSSAFQGVDVQKVDDYTVLFKLPQPYAPFLSSLTVGIAPQHVWESIAPRNATLAEQILKPVGTGPFQFSEITTRRRTGEITFFRLTRNPNYYGPRPWLDGITFAFYPTHEEAAQALKSGTANGMGFLPLQLHEDIAARSTLTIHRLLLPQYFGLFFNQQKSEVLNNAGIRDALALAIDREAIVREALRSQGEALHLPIPPGTLVFNEELPAPPFDPDAARQNLEEAGWHDVDGDGVREKDNNRLHLTLTTTDWPEYVRTAELIQQQWLDIGVETRIEHFGAGSIQQSAVRPREYEVLLFGEILSPEPDPYPFWHSTQAKSPGLNFAQFKDAAVDKLLEEGRMTADADKRREIYQEFQAKILELKPAIILYRPHYLFATSEQLRGVELHHGALPGDRLNDVEAWHLRTDRVWNEG